MAAVTHKLLTQYFTNSTLNEGNSTITMCGDHCCELCHNTSRDENSDLNSETELVLIVTMAILIVVLLTIMIISVLSYRW